MKSVLCKSYLRVNLAKVLIGFDSKNDDLRLSRLLMSLLPSDNFDKKDERRFKLELILIVCLFDWATFHALR